MKKGLTLKQVNALKGMTGVLVVLAAMPLYRRSELYGYLFFPVGLLCVVIASSLALRDGKKRAAGLVLYAVLASVCVLTAIFAQ